MTKMQYGTKWQYFWEEWIKPVIVAAILALIIRTFIVQPFKIPTGSMEPTFMPGDRIFVSKFIYGAKVPFTPIQFPAVREPETGDIVVFLSPVEKKKYLVKRFIAGGGQTVRIDDGKLYVDGRLEAKSPFSRVFYLNRGEYGAEGETILVPPEHFYVLGDNSGNSMDSRYWGFVPYDKLVGRAFMIHWPIRRIRLIKEGD